MATSNTGQQREQWSGQWGFALAAIGSAIGLGNIWRFPGVAYTNGGGAFIIPYLVALLTAGIPILLLDFSLGHRYRGSAPAVFRRLSKPLEALGWLQVAVSFVIITYYAVVLAWSARYTLYSLNLAWGSDPLTFFVGDYLQLADPAISYQVVPNVFWPLVVVWGAGIVIMVLGVSKGVERANKVFLPLLVAMFLALVVRAITLPGAAEGLNALFTPDWAALADAQVWLAAYSQIFFSLSVGFGIMLTYASYLKRKTDLTGTGLVTGFANSSFEILAGIGVFATLGFLAHQQGVTVSELEGITGPILSFVTFPTVISMMPGGPIFGVLFFGSLTLAGFTSLISLLQVVSAALQEKFNLSRNGAALLVGLLAGALSILLFSTTNGLNALDVVDKFINEIGIVGSAVLMIVFVGLVLRKLPLLRTHLNRVSSVGVGKWWYVVVAALDPLVLGSILVIVVISLVRDGYDSYPADFVLFFGWMMIAAVVLFSVVVSLLPWRTAVDDFDAERFHERADDALPDGPTPIRASEVGASFRLPTSATDDTMPNHKTQREGGDQ